MELIEKTGEFSSRFSRWRANDDLAGYPWLENVHSPFTTVKRALPMMNLALVTSAGAYIKGTEPFDIESNDGDASLREIPIEVEAADTLYSARGYDPADVMLDRNAQIPIDRLMEYQANSVIGSLNSVWWSISSYVPNAALVEQELAPAVTARLHQYSVQAALLIPSTRLCHQTMGIVARSIEQSGIPTIMLSVAPDITDKVRPPRSAYYSGEFGSVAGKPSWSEYQRRVLDETLRWLETFDQPGSRKLAVDLETQVEAARGER